MSTKVKESPEVIRTRKKLKKMIAEQNKHITPQALHKIRESILLRIQHDQGQRINLKGKTFTVFDNNQHSESPHNKYIQRLLSHLKKDLKQETRPLKSMMGRIIGS